MRLAVLMILSARLCVGASSGSPVLWIRSIAGSGGNTVAGMAADASGNVYVVGTTTSIDLPIMSAFQPLPGSSALVRIDGPGNAWSNLYAPGAISVKTMKAAPSNPGTVYAIAAPAGLIRTTDNGAHWTQLRNFSPDTLEDLAVDPSNSNVLYLALDFGSTPGLFKSVDGGATFAPVNNGIPPPASALGVWTDPNLPSVVFAGTNSGLARSADGGASWQLVHANGGSLTFDPFTPGTIYSLLSQSAEHPPAEISTDDGVTWAPLAVPLEGVYLFGPNAIVPDPRHRGVLYAIYRSDIQVSRDRGATWQIAAAQFPAGSVETPYANVVADPTTGAIYTAVSLAGTYGASQPNQGQVLMTTDGFTTLTPTGPPTLGVVNSLALANSKVFAGTQANPDVYVAKFDGSGNLLRLSYYGGSGADVASSMAVDASGAVYVTGSSTSLNLPVTFGAFAATGQSFLFKVNPDGSLAWSTYFADQRNIPNHLAVDAGGHVYLTGVSYGDLPITPGAYLSQPPQFTYSENFVAEFSPNGASLVFSTYFSAGGAVAAAADGSSFVAGPKAIYKLSPGGSAVTATSAELDGANALAIANDGSLYAVGSTSAATAAVPGGFQAKAVELSNLWGSDSCCGPSYSGFAAKLDRNLNILAATLFGGRATTSADAVALGSDGSVLVGGSTSAFDLPQANSIWAPFAAQTGFIAQLSRDLSTLNFSTFAGDSTQFSTQSVAFGADGSLLFAGSAGGPNALAPHTFIDAVAPGQAATRLDSVVNAASHLATPLSPGETIEIDGRGFNGSFTVLLNGTPIASALLDSTRFIAAVPADFSAQYATIALQNGGFTSNSILSPASAASPGIFSQDGSGSGQAYILNADGTLNSPSNPAAAGSAINIFATGVGRIGFVGPYAVTAAPVNVFIGGYYADGIGATLGPVAGLPGNVYRIGVYVPNAVTRFPPRLLVQMEVNGAYSQFGLALSVTP
jgi:uncharacterized protein (TIGR03437 family)